MQVTVEVNFGLFIRKRFTDLYRIYYLGPQNEYRRAVERFNLNLYLWLQMWPIATV